MRARLIKPGFFSSDELAELPPLTRILFAGLWCLADRAGRLDDRPRRIRGEVLPYDDCDADAMLDELVTAGFIHRYRANGRAYIQVVNFLKHQTPHVKEAASTIPQPDEHETSPVLAPDKHETSTPVPIPIPIPIPIPESLSVIPSVPEPSSAVASPDGDGQPALNGAMNGQVTAADWPDAAWIDAAFEDAFWPAYPRKTHKAEAKKVFRVLCRGQPAYERAYGLVERILEAVSEQSEHWQDPAYTPHAATYLRGERWADEIIIPTGRTAVAH